MSGTKTAFPQITPDMIVDGQPGLSRFEYAAIHIMAGIAASPINYSSVQDGVSDALIAAEALMKELDKRDG